jgi:cytochrome P450
MPARPGTRGCLRQPTQELLRLETPNEGFARMATREVTIRDRTIQAGQRVAFVFTSANRDAAVFDDPDEFRLDRDRNRSAWLGFVSRGARGRHTRTFACTPWCSPASRPQEHR